MATSGVSPLEQILASPYAAQWTRGKDKFADIEARRGTANPPSFLENALAGIYRGIRPSQENLGGLVLAMKPAVLQPGLKGDPGYAYHATNAENLYSIGESGRLKTHRPSFGTDQRTWPDGATEKRAYFMASPERIYQFAPEEGTPAILRTKKDGRIFTENTGDLFARKDLRAADLEFLASDNKWYPLRELFDK